MSRVRALTTMTLTACMASAVSSCDTPAGGRFPQGGVVSAADASPAADLVPAEGLRLAVGTEKAEYVLGEPVYAMIVLENTGEQTQRVLRELRPEGEVVRIFLTGADGREVLFRPLGYGDHDDTAWIDLAAGDQIGVTASIFFGADGWTFTEPGQYRLTALYTWGGEGLPVRQLRSDTATVVIGPGDQGGTLLTRGDAASLEAGKFLTWQAGDHLELGRELLLGLLDGSRGSVLASHAAFALGRSWGEPFLDYRADEVRPADCAQAASLLDQVAVAVLGTQAQALTEVARARCAAGEGDRAAALDHLARARGAVEGRPELQDLEAQILQYAANLAGGPG